jgi:MFS transporter, ACS family, tartrate transporter
MSITPALPRSPSDDEEAFGRRVLSKVAWRLIPLLGVLYIFNILDRVNVGFAGLTMRKDLEMSERVFDFGYGLFYLGYILFEVPSNLLLRRFGARKLIARILIGWGLVSCATMFIRGSTDFYLIRILLGVAEAGFFPGIILYLTFWFPARERARMVALFMVAIPLASIVGNPLSGAIMKYLHETAGLKGWQWLFLLEGLPSVAMGVGVLFILTDRPENARWLTPEERDWLARCLRQEEDAIQHQHGADRLRALFEDKRVWLLICLYFTVAVGANAFGGYLPRLLKGSYPSYDLFQIGLLGSLPPLCAMVGMALWGTHSDRTGERSGHVAIAALVAALGWALAALSLSPELSLVGLCLALMGMLSMLPVFWTLPSTFLTGAAAAGGIALINSIGNIGGLLGATILGEFGLWSMAGILFLGAGLALCVRPEKPMRKPTEGATNHV